MKMASTLKIKTLQHLAQRGIDMNTVKEFEDLGVEFVDDDKFVKFEVSVTSRNLRNNILIKSFAWRTNTGVKPAFSGDVEYDLKSGHRGVCKMSMLGFSSAAMDPLIKWRPHLAQSLIETPEEKEAFDKISPFDVNAHVSDFSNLDAAKMESAKPVFTPNLGERVIAFANGIELEGYLTQDGFLAGAGMIAASYTMNDATRLSFKPIDTRTDKEKAVDDMYYSWMDFKTESGDAIDKLHYELCEHIYGLGYHK
jgi:hypothetical protein